MKTLTPKGAVAMGVVAVSLLLGALIPLWHARDARNELTFENIPHLPMTVAWAKDLNAQAKNFRDAMDLYNDAAGCDVLVEAGSGEVPDIFIRSAASEIEPCGDWYRSMEMPNDIVGRHWRCGDGTHAIQLQNLFGDREWALAGGHEFGHALDHRKHDEVASIMRVPPDWWISTKDSKALAARCPR